MSLPHRLARLLMLCLVPQLAFQAHPLLANPTGATVAGGTAAIDTAGNIMTITTSDRAVIHWQGFSIGAGETTQFVQPSASSAVLNRVTSGEASHLLGTLQANGQVYLLNPNGVFIGNGAVINVGSFLATTANIADTDFMNGGNLTFSGATEAAIINEGSITATAGDVFLLARTVKNTDTGVISAPQGTVGLAAGTQFYLKKDEIGAMRVEVKPEAVAGFKGETGIDNVGLLQALRVQMEADGNLYGLAINQQGLVRATGVSRGLDGTIVLSAPGGTIRQSGTMLAVNADGSGGRLSISGKDISLTASSMATAAGSVDGGQIQIEATGDNLVSGRLSVDGAIGKAGRIQLTGNRVGLFDAEVTADGAKGGGEVLVGGDYQGLNPLVKNASRTFVSQESVISADATIEGDGGKVILWSDEYTGFYGNISAQGGSVSGNGGFIETSSKDNLQAMGSVNASAFNGQGGLWLLDPSDVRISNNASDGTFGGGNPDVFTPNNVNTADVNHLTIEAALNAGTSVTILTVSSAGRPGNITMSTGINKDATVAGTASTLTLIAAGSINISQNIESIDGSLDVILGAHDGVTIGAAVTTFGGNFTIQGATAIGDALAASTTTVTIGAGANISTLGGTGTGDFSVTATGAVNQTGGSLLVKGATSITTGNAAITLTQAANNFTGAVSLNNSGANNVQVTDTDAIILGASTVGGDLSVTANGAITDSGNLTVTGTATLAAGAANNITLDNANNFSTVAITTGNTVTLVDAGAIDLGASTVSGNLNVTADGAITDSGDLAVTGTTVLAAGAANDITLDQAGNNFVNAVTITSGNNVTLVDANAIDLGLASTVSGNLSVTANGAITDSGSLAVTGTTTLAAGAVNDITLNNGLSNFGGAVSITSGNNVTLVDANAINLGASTVSGTLDVTATTGNITQSGVLTVGGGSTFSVGALGANILLASAANDFSGAVTIGGTASNVQDFALRNINAGAGAVVNLGNSTSSLRDLTIIYNSAAYEVPTFTTVATLRNISITAGGAITQEAGGIVQGAVGTASFTTGSFAITLTDGANNFTGAVSLNNSGANNVQVTDTDAIILGTSSVGTGTLTVNAVGITQTGAITQAAGADLVTFVAGPGNINLSNTANNFTGVVAISSAAGVTLRDANALLIGATSTTGGQVFVAAGTITSTGAKAATGSNLLIQSTGGGVTLGAGSTYSSSLTQVVVGSGQSFVNNVSAAAFTGTAQIFTDTENLNTPSTADAGLTGFFPAFDVTPVVTVSASPGVYTLSNSTGSTPSGNTVAYLPILPESEVLTAAEVNNILSTDANLTTVPMASSAVGIFLPSLDSVSFGAILPAKPAVNNNNLSGGSDAPIRVSFRGEKEKEL